MPIEILTRTEQDFGHFCRHILLSVLALLILPCVGHGADCPPGSIMSDYGLEVLERAPAGERIAYGQDPLQFGELMVPVGDGPFPVVVVLHGGCWLAEYDLKHMRALVNAIRDEGFAVWNLEYRRVGNAGGGWPGTFLDVGAGTDYVRELARRFPLDLARVYAIGHSAGGHLALWLATRDRIPSNSDLYQPNPVLPTSIVALEPAVALGFLHQSGICGQVIDKLIGGSPEVKPQRYSQVSPLGMIPLGVPQTIIAGWLSGFGMLGQVYYNAAVQANDALVQLIEAPEAGHFEVINPASTTWPLVREAVQTQFR